jgi:hypothetical protein
MTPLVSYVYHNVSTFHIVVCAHCELPVAVGYASRLLVFSLHTYPITGQ